MAIKWVSGGHMVGLIHGEACKDSVNSEAGLPVEAEQTASNATPTVKAKPKRAKPRKKS